MCDIDDFSELKCNFIDNENFPIISFNPDICLVKPNTGQMVLKGIGRNQYINWLNHQLEDFINDDGFGSILNIYLEFDFVQSLLESNIDIENEGKVTLYKFLKEICNGINSSLAHMVELEPTIDEERNYVVIRDQKITPTINNPALPANPALSTPIKIYGIRENSSSFVRDFSFTTELTPKYSSIISISATAANQSISEDATSIQKWNAGLIDRFKLSTQDGVSIEEETNESFRCGPQEAKSFSTNALVSRIKGHLARITGSVSELTRAITESYNSALRERLQISRENYLYNLALALGINNQTIFLNSIGADITLTDSVKRGSYFTTEFPNLSNKLYQLWITNFIRVQNSLEDDQTISNSNNIGFIPVRLTLELDGISGIKIYNSLRIQSDLLPENYP